MVAEHNESVYPALVLGFLKSGSFNITVKDGTTIGALVYDNIPNGGLRVNVSISLLYIIRREAPRCSFYCDGHLPEPQEAGRVTDTDSHAFFYTNPYGELTDIFCIKQ